MDAFLAPPNESLFTIFSLQKSVEKGHEEEQREEKKKKRQSTKVAGAQEGAVKKRTTKKKVSPYPFLK